LNIIDNSNVNFNFVVVCQPWKEDPANRKDKFLIQSMVVGDDILNSNEVVIKVE
jgi:hypothetical protein